MDVAILVVNNHDHVDDMVNLEQFVWKLDHGRWNGIYLFQVDGRLNA